MELIAEIGKTDPQLAEKLVHLLNELELARTERQKSQNQPEAPNGINYDRNN